MAFVSQAVKAVKDVGSAVARVTKDSMKTGDLGLSLSIAPAYYYNRGNQRKRDHASQDAARQEQAIVQTKNDAQNATNQSIIDAKRRRRASSLFSSDPLGGDTTALGQVGGQATNQPAGTALGSVGGY